MPQTDLLTPTVLIVPGLREHVAEHWQTLLAAKLPRVRSVPPLQHDKLSCAARVDAVERAVIDIDGPVIIVAHSAGAMMVVHWAATHATRRVCGALLAAPADLETAMPAPYPTLDALRSNGWLPVPRQTLPFPSVLAASSNDPLMRLERARDLAGSWGSRFAELGPAGHLNPASGYGPWPMADEILREFSESPQPKDEVSSITRI